MKILDTRVYRGRNIYSHRLCIKLTVDVEDMYDTPTKDIDGFNMRLLKVLPGFKKHKCSLGYEGGFIERLETGTYLPHVFEHMLIEMQNELGFKDIKFGKARCIEKTIYNVIFQYELEDAALLCIKYGLECINSLIEGKDYDLKSALDEIEKRISEIRLGPSTKGVYDEAVKRGIPVIRIGRGSILQFGYGKNGRRIEATLTDRTPCIAVDIACNKELTREVLKGIGIPVALGECAENVNDALKICEEIGFPVAIKPLDGSQGRGVTVGIEDEKTAILAFNIASRINKRVLVEKYIQGKDYRILVVNKKVVAVSLRIPPYVAGDGVRSIGELVSLENMNPLRGYNHEKPLTKISIDDVCMNCLKLTGKDVDYIPKDGERVKLRFNANLSTGGTARDCTDIIHPDNVEMAIKAAEAVGLDIAGVDICTKDISKPIAQNGGVILEVNAAPGIRMHMYPNKGKSRNAATHVLDYLFQGVASPIPVVSVTGTNGKTTVTRMIAHILSLKGICVGMTTTCGIYINNKCISKGDNTGLESARTVLMDKSVEAAVLETARGGILKRGLGYDLADVGVITNISDDHIGIDGIESIEDLIHLKALVVEAVKEYGYAVLNADDPSVNILSQRVKSNIIYFSRNPDNIILKKHLQDGGLGIFIKNNFIYLGDGEILNPIVSIKDIPSTMEGMLGHNVENALAATAACIGIKEDIGLISRGLKTFFLDDTQNPGRFNIYSINNFKVVVDYGHNIEGYKAVIEGLKGMKAKRLIGIIGVPGDRMDSSIFDIGKISGGSFDYIYIKEDMDKRGRGEGEVASILEKGIVSAQKNQSSYKIIFDEAKALKTAMESALDGDCIVVFYEDYDRIMKAINAFKNFKAGEKVDINVI